MAQAEHQLKFVVDAPADLKEIEIFLQELGGVERNRVLLMPQGITRKELDDRAEWLVEYCKRENYRYCPRLHIELYGNKRGT
jgi:7-carboxy-7-deazaguanine synthase